VRHPDEVVVDWVGTAAVLTVIVPGGSPAASDRAEAFRHPLAPYLADDSPVNTLPLGAAIPALELGKMLPLPAVRVKMVYHGSEPPKERGKETLLSLLG
jgi:hypothetical protein